MRKLLAKLIVCAALLLCLASLAGATAPTTDVLVNYTNGTPAQTFTWTHTTGAGLTSGELIVQAGGATALSGVTANSVSMTQIVGDQYAIAAVASTTYTIVASYSITTTFAGESISWNNVAASPFSGANTASTTSSPLSASVSSDTNSVVIGLTSGTGTFTAVQNSLWGNGSSHAAGYAAGSASTTISFTYTGGVATQTMTYFSMEGTTGGGTPANLFFY